MMRTGPLNLIADVAGLTVGNAEDHRLKSGVTAIVCDPPATAAVQVLGGAPGTRETDLLDPHNTVQTVDALVLSGGSAFGLDAASGAQAALREMGRGFAVGPHRIPIVPTAILFDLINGGDKDWGRYPPYRELGFEAVRRAGPSFATGTAGAGTGALTATVKGGLGSASTVLPSGITIGALVAVNALGSATVGDSRHFWSAPFELDGEFGALGLPHPLPADAADIRIKFRDRQSAAANTTIAVIATDARNRPRVNRSRTRFAPREPNRTGTYCRPLRRSPCSSKPRTRRKRTTSPFSTHSPKDPTRPCSAPLPSTRSTSAPKIPIA